MKPYSYIKSERRKRVKLHILEAIITAGIVAWSICCFVAGRVSV
jgi:hypothetical protein